MNLYIKCSSRPFYLERLLRSIEMNCRGVGKLILLNDGIPAPRIARLAQGRPHLEERRSPRLVAGGAPDPGRFWAREVGAEGRRLVMVLEEDTWLVAPIDLDAVERVLLENQAIMMRMFWHGAAELTAAAAIQYSAQAADGFTIDFYGKVDAKRFVDRYNYFCVAHGIFRADYYSQTMLGTAHWADEVHLLQAAVSFINTAVARGEKFRFAKSREEMFRHSSATTSRADSGGLGVAPLDARAVNEALNQAWENGELDVMAGYPGDIAEDVLAAQIGRRLGAAALDQWRRWREDYLRIYEDFGAKL